MRKGDIQSVKQAIESGSSANDTDPWHGGLTILHWAASHTDADTIFDTLDLKAQVQNPQTYSDLLRTNNYENGDNFIRWQRRHNNACNDTDSLCHFIGAEAKMPARRQIVDVLLEHGADANAVWWRGMFCMPSTGMHPWDMTEDERVRAKILEASLSQALASIQSDEKKEYKLQGGLIAAACLNRVDAINEIISAGASADDDSCDTTALIEATREVKMEATTALVEKFGKFGAKVDHRACETDYNEFGSIRRYVPLFGQLSRTASWRLLGTYSRREHTHLLVDVSV